MKISLEWLGEHLAGELRADELAEALTHGGLPVESIEKRDGDTVLDVEVTSNRGDCLSHLGIARELSALLGRELKEPSAAAPRRGVDVQTLARVQNDADDLCPLYTARVVRGVKIGPSPVWMRRRLEAVGIRAISNIVDVTNYVMLELGHPLHAFDYDHLDERRIVVRRAADGERMTSIDGHERVLNPSMLVIADARRPVALAGVMGGRDSEVSDQTVNVLLESARFDPLCIRRTARALAMHSESSYRFERGLDPQLAVRASLRAAQLMVETAGGELADGIVTAGTGTVLPRRLSLRLARVASLLGVDFPVEQVVQALHRLGLKPELSGSHVEVTVPSHRLDLNIEADLVEEVARVLGYGRIPTRSTIEIRLAAPEPQRRSTQLIRQSLCAAGYFEAVTFSWLSDSFADSFTPAQAVGLLRAQHAVRKADGRLRPSLLPGLLEALVRNENVGAEDARLFEIGSVYWQESAGHAEHRRLALAGGGDVRDTRGAVEMLLSRLDARRSMRFEPADAPGYARGAAARVVWGDEVIGHLGLLDAAVAERIALRAPVGMAELNVTALLAGARAVPQQAPLPRFQAVRRDMSLIVDEAVRYEQIEQAVRQAAPSDMESLNFVTTYRGKPLPAGKKSVTLSLVFRSAEGTLTSAQVDEPMRAVLESARQLLKAEVRS